MLHYTVAALVVLFILGIGMTVGLLVKIARDNSDYGGKILVDKSVEGVTRYTLEFDGDPDDIQYKEEILFKVVPMEESNLIRE